jgi:hypothetical protein
MSSWQERGMANAYMETQSVSCTLCGKSIPNKAWVVENERGELLFCEPDCERLYLDYWLPKYGLNDET